MKSATNSDLPDIARRPHLTLPCAAFAYNNHRTICGRTITPMEHMIPLVHPPIFSPHVDDYYRLPSAPHSPSNMVQPKLLGNDIRNIFIEKLVEYLDREYRQRGVIYVAQPSKLSPPNQIIPARSTNRVLLDGRACQLYLKAPQYWASCEGGAARMLGRCLIRNRIRTSLSPRFRKWCPCRVEAGYNQAIS